MAKTEKKVSIALFDKIVKEHFQNEATIQWHEAESAVASTMSWGICRKSRTSLSRVTS